VGSVLNLLTKLLALIVPASIVALILSFIKDVLYVIDLLVSWGDLLIL
jgi:hypothetical protein